MFDIGQMTLNRRYIGHWYFQRNVYSVCFYQKYFYHLDCNNLTLISKQTPIKKNTLLATISKMKKQYSVHVEFMINESFPTNVWHNMFHATISGGKDVYGSRIPGIWIKHQNGNMFALISAAVNGEKSYQCTTPGIPVQLNKWRTISVSQIKVGGEYQYKIEMNGELKHMVNNTQPREFQHVKIYISDPWHRAVSGYVRNVFIKGKVKLITFGALCDFVFAYQVTKRYNAKLQTEWDKNLLARTHQIN